MTVILQKALCWAVCHSSLFVRLLCLCGEWSLCFTEQAICSLCNVCTLLSGFSVRGWMFVDFDS